MITEERLLQLKKEVDEARTKVSELTGQRTALMNQLRTDWKCTTVEKAEEKLKVLKESIKTLDEKIDMEIEELEEQYEL